MRIGACVVFFVLLLGAENCFAQDQIYVPFRKGNLFGLSNLQGKLVVPAKYQSIRVLGNGFFEYKEPLNESINTPEEEKNSFHPVGVMHLNKIILKPKDHGNFRYLTGSLLVGSKSGNGDYAYNCNFYLESGEPLFPDNLFRCKVIVPVETSQPQIAIIAEKGDNTLSIYVFDPIKKQLVTPLLDGVFRFRMENPNVPRFIMLCTYYDRNNNPHKDVIYYNYKLQQHVRMDYVSDEQIRNLYQSEEVNPNLRLIADNSKRQVLDRTDVPLNRFSMREPSVLKYNGKPVLLDKEEKVIFAGPEKNQSHPLIYVKDKAFGLRKDSSQKTPGTYDTLIYVKQAIQSKQGASTWFYLAGLRKNNGDFLWGVINELGLVCIPIVYDSIGLELPVIKHVHGGDNNTSFFEFRSEKNESYTSRYYLENRIVGAFLVKQKGYYGLIHESGEIIVPVSMDRIWKNTLAQPLYYDNSRFYVYQRGDTYGAFELDIEGKRTKDTGLTLHNIPTYYYRDYMGVPGLDIYNVAIPGNLLYGLENKNGQQYYW